MAEHNALVTDTHPLVFHVAGGRGRLGTSAAAHFEACDRQEAIVYVPVAVMWECCCLDFVGKIKLKQPPKVFFKALFENPAYQALVLTPDQVLLVPRIPPQPGPFRCAHLRSGEKPGASAGCCSSATYGGA